MTNKIFFILYYFLFIILFTSPLWAQSPGGRYVVEQRYVQKLEWIGDNYTLKYEVVIEQEDGGGAQGGAQGGYKAYIREFTEKPGFQVSLPSGKYRYRVIPYDYLEQPGEASGWVEININPPPIVSVEVQKADDGSYVLHPYENEQIVPGVNRIVINNTDNTVITGVDETEKLLNLYVSASWTPVIPLYGRMNEIFGNGLFISGASVRFGAFYNKPRWLKPGIEFLASWYTLYNYEGNDSITVQTGVTGLNITTQKEFSYPKIVTTLRVGFAFTYQVNELNVEGYSNTAGGLIPQINFEASILWFAYKRLYIETGLGFNHLIDKDDNSGCLCPWIGVVWRF